MTLSGRNNSPKLFHAKTAAAIAGRDFAGFVDDEIISGVIDGSMSGEAIATELSKLIIRAKMTAIGKGMLENPMTRQLIEIDRSELLRSAQEISDKRGPCTVTVRAARETDNRGPLEIFIDVK